MRNLFHGLIAAALLAVLPVGAQAGVFVSVTIAPPVLPVYVQPPMPAPGYIWTPGYWAWNGEYYWVPGTWVMAPVGLLWTPGYWGWVNGAYIWNAGYWGPHVGFYGGVNYGFGYGGVGFAGGEWRGGQLFYNRSVTNIGTTNVTNVYNRTVVNNVTVNNVSYNGGAGGIAARPTAAEVAASRETHTPPTQLQTQHQVAASHDTALRASVNGGHPAIAATARPGAFSGAGVVAARGASPPNRTTAGAEAGRAPARGGSYQQGGGFSQPRGGAAADRPQAERAPANPQSRYPQGQPRAAAPPPGQANPRGERPEGRQAPPREERSKDDHPR